MADTQMEGLSFKITQDGADETIKQIDSMAQALEKLKKATDTISKSSFNSQAKSLSNFFKTINGASTADAAKNLNETAKALSKISNIKEMSNLKNITDGIKQISQALKGSKWTNTDQAAKLFNSLSKLNSVKIPDDITTGIDSILESVRGITDSDLERVTQLANLLTRVSAMQNTRGTRSSRQNGTNANDIANAQAVNPQGTEITVKAQSLTGISRVLNSIKSSAVGLKGTLTGLFDGTIAPSTVFKQALVGVESGLKKVASAAIHKSLSSLSGSFNKASTAASGFLRSIGRIAMYRAIRAIISQITQAIKEGINNLYQYSALMGTTFAGSLDSLATSAQYLKNSLGAMAAPLIQAVAPAIEYVIEKVVELLNWFNMLIARLTGSSTATVARRAATTFGSVGSSASDAASGVSDLKKSIMSFDELNTLTDNSSGSGGSGGGSGSGTDYGSMFEQVPIASDIANFADALKKAFNAGDWQTLGTLLADKVNSIVDAIDFNSIGKKIGYGLNGAIQTAYYFLKGVDFKNIGVGIADLINGALSEIDGTFIGRTIVVWFTNIADFLIGAIEELDWTQVIQTLVDIFTGIFAEGADWLNEVDWYGFGKSIGESIIEALGGVDWSDFAYELFRLLGAALKVPVEFGAGVISGILGSLGEAIDAQDGSTFAEKFVNWIIEGVKAVWSTLWNGVIGGLIDGIFGDGTWETVKKKGEEIAKNVWQGIKDFFTNNPVADFIGSLFGDSSASVDVSVGTTTAAIQVPAVANVEKWVDKLGTISKDITAKAKTWKDNLGTVVKDVQAKAKTWKDNLGTIVKDVTAKAKTWKDSLGTIIKNVTAKATTWKDSLGTIVKKITGNATTYTDSTGSRTKNISIRANSYSDSTGSKTKTVTARATSFQDGLGYTPTITVKAKANSLVLSGGTIASLNADGGIYSNGNFSRFSGIPHYANGTYDAHGSVFIAGEAGPEVVGNINGRTEILNKSQLAITMHSAVASGMASAISELSRAIGETFVSCTNAQISALNNVNTTIRSVPTTTAVDNADRDDEDLAEKVRRGVSDAMTSQNSLLREQNRLLQQLLAKDNTVEITTSQITSALSRKNTRDGVTVVPVST